MAFPIILIQKSLSSHLLQIIINNELNIFYYALKSQNEPYQSTEVRCTGPERLKISLSEIMGSSSPILPSSIYPQISDTDQNIWKYKTSIQHPKMHQFMMIAHGLVHVKKKKKTVLG